MILILQVFLVLALVSGASRVISEAVEWLFFGGQTAPERDDLVG